VVTWESESLTGLDFVLLFASKPGTVAQILNYRMVQIGKKTKKNVKRS
jgi:hypothetical protein